MEQTQHEPDRDLYGVISAMENDLNTIEDIAIALLHLGTGREVIKPRAVNALAKPLEKTVEGVVAQWRRAFDLSIRSKETQQSKPVQPDRPF